MIAVPVCAEDLLFYAEQVRGLGTGDCVSERAEIIASYIEWQARQLLVADITEQS